MSATRRPNSLAESPTFKGFAAEFGEDQAKAIFAAAESHTNGVHDKMGSDPFRWALTIAIGHQCAEVADYRRHHGITAPWRKLKAWIKDYGNLANHDGDVDYLSLFAGVYNEFMPSKEATS